MEIVENQIRGNDPPETRQTHERLLAEGYPDAEARRLIACAVVSELFDIMKQRKSFDPQRFAAALGKLPTMPWD